VRFHGVWADADPGGDLLVRGPGDDHAQDLELALRQEDHVLLGGLAGGSLRQDALGHDVTGKPHLAFEKGLDALHHLIDGIRS